MKITIAERLKPFSHTPGAACLIPGTCCKVEAYPTLIRLAGQLELRLHLTGPVRDFTLEQHLEKNCVYLFGKAREGFYRLRLHGSEMGIELLADKLPTQGLVVNGSILRQKDRLFFPMELGFFLPQVWERLSLGVSKGQDWDLVLRRFDLKEILPVLFGLSQKIPYQEFGPLKGAAKLLIGGDLEALCRAGFSNILIPRLFDDQYQGIAPEDSDGEDPSFLLQEAGRLVRSLFFRQERNCLELLPACPFDAGRMTRLQASSIGEIDLEWASGTLRRAILRSSSSDPIFLVLQKGLRSFRVRTVQSGRGQRHVSSDPLFLEAGRTYYLDRFQS